MIVGLNPLPCPDREKPCLQQASRVECQVQKISGEDLLNGREDRLRVDGGELVREPDEARVGGPDPRRKPRSSCGSGAVLIDEKRQPSRGKEGCLSKGVRRGEQERD